MTVNPMELFWSGCEFCSIQWQSFSASQETVDHHLHLTSVLPHVARMSVRSSRTRINVRVSEHTGLWSEIVPKPECTSPLDCICSPIDVIGLNAGFGTDDSLTIRSSVCAHFLLISMSSSHELYNEVVHRIHHPSPLDDDDDTAADVRWDDDNG